MQEIIYINNPLLSPTGGDDLISGDTQFKVIIAEIRHLGDQPTSIGEAGIFVGPLFYAKFDLPANLDPEELAVIQCRTKDNQLNNKMFFLNHKPLPDILEPHPNNKEEWMMDIAIVPKGWLKPGENNIHIGYADEQYDDFIVDNLVLWFKIKHTVPEPTESEPDHGEKKDIDSLEDLSSLDVKIYKDTEAKDHFSQ